MEALLTIPYWRKYRFHYVFFGSVGLAMLVLSFLFYTPLEADDFTALILYLFMALFVASFPLRIQEVSISFTLAVSIAMIARYGVVVEAWLMLLTTVILYLFMRARRVESEILVWSSVLVVSWLSGAVFVLVGGTIGAGENVAHLFSPVLAYTFTVIVVAHVCHVYFFQRKSDRNRLGPAYWQWRLISAVISVSLGILLYAVQDGMGLLGIVMLGIPLLAISYILRLYNTLEQMNRQMTLLNQLSLSFSLELSVESTLDALHEGVTKLVGPDICWVFWLDEETEELYPIKVCGPLSEGFVDEWMAVRIPVGEGLVGRVVQSNRTAIIHRHAKAYELYVRSAVLQSLNSLIAVPMRLQKRTVGVVALGNTTEFAYDRRTKTLIEILANQAGIAVENAGNYESLAEANHRDELTGVLNYRAFMHTLDTVLTHPGTKSAGLMMIDIDHFKQVNDTYGHLAGNEILRQLTRVLLTHVRLEDTVARYGGEEFVVILPNVTQETAESIAERLRRVVASHTFVLHESMGQEKASTVNITLSVGIALYPEQSWDGTSLVRHADRAMYLGSKQQGRNRVSVYQAG